MSAFLHSSHFDEMSNHNYIVATHSFRRARIVENQRHDQYHAERRRRPVRSHGTTAAGAVNL